MKQISIKGALLAMIALVGFAIGQQKYTGTTPQTFTILEELQDKINTGTLSPIETAIIDESFEGAFPPAGWQKLNPDGGTGWTQVAIGTSPVPGWVGGEVTGPPDGGANVAFSTWNTGGTTSNDQWMVSPQITDVADVDSFYFWMRYWPNNFADNVDVRISTTNGNDPAAFDVVVAELVFGATGDTTTSWQRYAFKTTDYVAAGSDIYIGIREHVADNYNDGASISMDRFVYDRISTTARLQVIHNAADPGAAVVDVYVDGALLPALDDFAFRAATPYIDFPGDTPVNVGVAPGSSTSVNDTLANFVVNLPAGGTFVAIANGVLNPDDFAANPDGRNIGFTIFPVGDAREAGSDPGLVDFFAFHGATDAPTVDVIARGVATLVDNAAYGDNTDYVSVPPASYILDVTPGDANDVIVASFEADLSGLAGGAAVVFASGFLTPDANQNGEAFGLFAALPTGDVVGFPALTTARLQVIHNAADPGAAAVDVYVDGALLPALDDFAFRSATPYIDFPGNVPVNVGVAGASSGSVNDTLANFVVNLPAGGTYVAIANGVLDPSNFAANPDARSTAFTIFPVGDTRETGSDPGLVDFFAFHGATDAPTVDVIARGVATLVDNAAYGDNTDYVSVPPASYILDVTPGDANDVIVASFEADLSGLAGGAAVVFASGFLTPDANQNGEAFGLFAALPTGDVVGFPALTTARLQVIHNAADPGAAVVDVYVDGALLPALDDFAFRSATPYIDFPGNVPVNVGVAGASSGSVNDTLANFVVNLPAGGTYVAIANGVLDPTSFAANPDGRSTAFTIFPIGDAREAASDPGMVDFFAFHGATDAPTVDVIARGVATLVDNAAYGDNTGYVSVPPASYILDVTPGDDNNTIVAAFEADLSGLAGGAAVVFASGFLDPTMNQNGEGFGLFAALPTGDVVGFSPTSVGIEEEIISNISDRFELSQNYPNPFNPSTTIEYSVPTAELVSIKVFNVLGQTVATLVNDVKQPGVYSINFDASELTSGVYIYQIQAGSFMATRKMVLMK